MLMQMILIECSELKGKRKHEGRKGAQWEEGIPWEYEVDNYENSWGYDQSALYMCEIVKESISQ